MSPEAGVGARPCSDPGRAHLSPDHHCCGLSLQLLSLYIHYAANSPQLQPSHLSVHPYICFPRSPTHSLRRAQLFIRSFRHSISRESVSQSSRAAARSHRTQKTATRVLCYWSDRLNWVLIEFRYIFIIADNHYTRYLQSLWNITIGIYRNFVQNMPDFNAWIVGSLLSHFWRTKHWPKSHWCLEVL